MAALNLGVMLERGMGGPADLAEAEAWFRVAASENNELAQCHLGVRLYTRGLVTEAISWFEKAIEKGYDDPRVWLAIVAEESAAPGTEVDRSFQVYRDLAAANGLAAIRLAKCHEAGRFTPRNLVAAEKWYRRAVGLGRADASYELGRMLYDQDRVAEAFGLMETAADGGVVEALAFCGESYVFGIDTNADPQQGVPMLERAAGAGHKRAKYLLAYLLNQGQILESDRDAAWLLCREAAELGEVEAQHMLGVMYLRGEGVERSTDSAVQWFRLAKSNGSLDAEAALAALDVS